MVGEGDHRHRAHHRNECRILVVEEALLGYPLPVPDLNRGHRLGANVEIPIRAGSRPRTDDLLVRFHLVFDNLDRVLVLLTRFPAPVGQRHEAVAHEEAELPAEQIDRSPRDPFEGASAVLAETERVGKALGCRVGRAGRRRASCTRGGVLGGRVESQVRSSEH